MSIVAWVLALWAVAAVIAVACLRAYANEQRCPYEEEDAANEALWALDEGRAYANDLLRSRALLVVTSGDDYGYAAKANYAEVLRIAAASDSPFPYFDAVCEVSARIETENDPVWRAL
jgi:hypothetical protein